jgi:hypothetical protein
MIWIWILIFVMVMVVIYWSGYIEYFGNGYDYNKDYNDNRRSLYDDYKRKMGYLLSYDV